jgi:hypothetical protein
VQTSAHDQTVRVLDVRGRAILAVSGTDVADVYWLLPDPGPWLVPEAPEDGDPYAPWMTAQATRPCTPTTSCVT